MATTVLGPLLPLLAARWGLSDVAAGSLFSAQFTGQLTATTVSALITARLGTSGTFALGYALIAAGVGGLGVVPAALSWPATLVYGLGLGCVLPVTNNVAAAMSPGRESSALSLVNVSWGVGAMVWPLVVGGWANHPARATTALALGAAAVALTWALAAPLEPGGVGAAGGGAPARPPSSATVLRLAILIFLYVGAEIATAGWAAAFARRMSAGGDGLWAYAPAAFWGALTLGRLTAPLWLVGIAERRLLVGCLVAGCAAVAAMATRATTAGHVVALSAAAGYSLAAIFPLLWADVVRAVAPTRPALVGPLYAAGGVGGALLPWLVGAVSTGSNLAVGLSLPLAALAAALVIVLAGPASEPEKP
jgi:fucose permease